jgi:hypothetical protein
MRENIPHGEAAMIEYGANIHSRNGKYASVLGLKADEIADLEALRLAFKTLHEQCVNRDQPKSVTQAKNKARDDYKESLRRFINALQSNPKMTDAIRADYGIAIRRTRAKVVPPDCGPGSTGDSSAKAVGRVTVAYDGAKADPSLTADIGFHVGPNAVMTHDELSQFENFSHNPWTHTFPDTQSGMVFTYALRWRAKSGAVSKWSSLRFFRIS